MPKLPKKGHFVVIEGTDGSGKNTQVKLLRKKLQILGQQVQILEFPRYSGNPYGKIIGQYLRGEFGGLNDVNTYLISLAYAGDRSLAKPDIEHWLKQKQIIIADRYVPSNKAYMSARLHKAQREQFIEWLDDLEYNINAIPREELVIFLYAPTDISYQNISKKHTRDYTQGKSHDLHEENKTYQAEVAKMYLQLAKQEPNWVTINCVEKGKMKSIEQIHQEILEKLRLRKIIDV